MFVMVRHVVLMTRKVVYAILSVNGERQVAKIASVVVTVIPLLQESQRASRKPPGSSRSLAYFCAAGCIGTSVCQAKLSCV